ncbi:MAG: Hsp20/alpha crystallin family protein [Candidatus Altiarchaeia archaeon]
MTKKPLRRRKTDRSFEDVIDMDRFFDEYMTRIDEQMAGFFEDALYGRGQTKGFFYGFQMTAGPDGKPELEEFGTDIAQADEETNAKPQNTNTKTHLSEDEPLTDVINGEKEVRVLAELPGVEREDIKIEVKPSQVSLNVDTETRKYRKDIMLPCRVSTENIKTTHKNGILEIIISKPI